MADKEILIERVTVLEATMRAPYPLLGMCISGGRACRLFNHHRRIK